MDSKKVIQKRAHLFLFQLNPNEEVLLGSKTFSRLLTGVLPSKCHFFRCKSVLKLMPFASQVQPSAKNRASKSLLVGHRGSSQSYGPWSQVAMYPCSKIDLVNSFNLRNFSEKCVSLFLFESSNLLWQRPQMVSSVIVQLFLGLKK